MRLRCRRKDLWIYQRYGGRGITICERWNDFRNFLADVGEKILHLFLHIDPSAAHPYDDFDARKIHAEIPCEPQQAG